MIEFLGLVRLLYNRFAMLYSYALAGTGHDTHGRPAVWCFEQNTTNGRAEVACSTSTQRAPSNI
jgi:hypothetical protein